MDLKLVAASVLLVLLCSDVSSYHLQKREAEEKEISTQLQEAAKSYWNQALSWLEQVKPLQVQEKLSDILHKGTAAMSTYSGIVHDQVYHWWYGDH
ncbi:apolipoprotein C-II-like [Rhineura floridana]|uniref:apolipoprotein C-II-like n=1 Tax=Rhineura floridana TaxID=261503 RepID=UPI002AC7F5A9|nr:apolipoprotein C-II-like [Rhineura floridana]